jgi:neutral trehalase
MQWREAAARRLEAIMATMWDAEHHCWHDLLLPRDETLHGAGCAVRRSALHAASWTPFLWGTLEGNDSMVTGCLAAMKESGLVQPAGLCTTLAVTDQQWDGENCWPPLLCSWVDGLTSYGGAEGRRLAHQLGRAYLGSVAQALADTGVVWEKFNATKTGAVGAGGEYTVQQGFGWSNGAAMHMIVSLGLSL